LKVMAVGLRMLMLITHAKLSFIEVMRTNSRSVKIL
jgi:hypothetical protein